MGLILELPDNVYARLEHLRTLDGSKDLSEIIRRALAVYDAALGFTCEDGGSLIARGRNGVEHEFSLELTPPAR